MAFICLQLNSMRKQIKPVSGTVGRKKKEDENRKQHATFNGPTSQDEPRRRMAANAKSPQRDPNQRPPFNPQKSPAVTRNAKKKWEMLERKVSLEMCYISGLILKLLPIINRKHLFMVRISLISMIFL